VAQIPEVSVVFNLEIRKLKAIFAPRVKKKRIKKIQPWQKFVKSPEGRE
jgi:hypothetical protein